jgi:ribosome-associated protein
VSAPDKTDATAPSEPVPPFDPRELEFKYVRAPGPGGQHLHKTASAVQLRFDVKRSASLSAPVRARLLQLAGRRVSAQGVLLIEAHRFRSQERNRADAIARLCALIARASVAPKARKPTRPPRAAGERRLTAKREHAARKQMRRAPRGNGD